MAIRVKMITGDHAGTAYAPFMQQWFGSVALELRHWLIPLGIAAGAFLVIETEKALTRRLLSGP